MFPQKRVMLTAANNEVRLCQQQSTMPVKQGFLVSSSHKMHVGAAAKSHVCMR